MDGSVDYVSDRLQGPMIRIHENERRLYLGNLDRMLVENRDKALGTISDERPSMTERALLALQVYGDLGLTVRELYGKRDVWLYFPGEGSACTISEKGVSMLLGRLKLHSLADREKEGRERRYRISNGGRGRLAHCKKMHENARMKREREREEKSRLEVLQVVSKFNRGTINQIKANNTSMRSWFTLFPQLESQAYFGAYNVLSGPIAEMAEAIYSLQRALITGVPALRDLAFQESTQILSKVKETQVQFLLGGSILGINSMYAEQQRQMMLMLTCPRHVPMLTYNARAFNVFLFR